VTEVEPDLLTPEALAKVGIATEVTEMYGVVDVETVRRYIVGIPDQDPRHWEADLAPERFGGPTTPPAMVSHIATRKPPWEEDRMNELMLADWHRDTVSMTREGQDLLYEVRQVTGTRSHLHGGDEIEIYRYPEIGDKVFYQSKVADLQETVDKNGRHAVIITRETRYWNQKDETLCVIRVIGIERR
jgi:hypothetical protein